MEALIAFILISTVIFMTADASISPSVAAISIGFALDVGVLLGGPVSGGAGNPARALGPMIVAGTFPRMAVLRARPAGGRCPGSSVLQGAWKGDGAQDGGNLRPP